MPAPESAAAKAATPAFCPNCGVALTGFTCASCGARNHLGAKFCSECGAVAPAAAGARFRGGRAAGVLPWAITFLALFAVVGLAASQRFRSVTATEGGGAPAGQTGIIAAPDISSLTPAERAERLYDRVMAAAERGRDDSVRFFMPMAIGAYEALGDLSLDQRYDLGRLGEVSGDARLAAAEADTILRKHPQHLLGLILAARAARLSGNATAERQFLQQLARSEAAERRKQLPEYQVHQNDIEAALADARQRAR